MLTSEEHYILASSGAIYSRGAGTHALWSHYLGEFEEVVVVARVDKDGYLESQGERADGPGVRFCALPDHTGPWQHLRVLGRARKVARLAIAESGACLLRVPGIVGQLVWREVVNQRRPYAAEVLGDPWDALAAGTWPGVTRPLFRMMATRQLKQICGGAAAVHYVTSEALQTRYPAAGEAYVEVYSDAELEFAPNGILAEKQQRLREQAWQLPEGPSLRIGFIGSFATMYKGADLLLHAAATCRAQGLNFSLILLGEGQHLAAMKELAIHLGLAHCTEFPGHLSSRKELLAFLDVIDLFAMPSRAEGMPRALLEAMARGCPCVGSKVGGIPEVLDSESLVPVEDCTRLAERILQFAQDGPRMAAMSARNVAMAQEFRPEVLGQARQAFLKAVKERTRIG